MSALGVRRGKAALSSGCKSRPATAPAGSDRSSYGGDEIAEAFTAVEQFSVLEAVEPPVRAVRHQDGPPDHHADCIGNHVPVFRTRSTRARTSAVTSVRSLTLLNKALRLTVPETLLATADEVIQ